MQQRFCFLQFLEEPRDFEIHLLIIYVVLSTPAKSSSSKDINSCEYLVFSFRCEFGTFTDSSFIPVIVEENSI